MKRNMLVIGLTAFFLLMTRPGYSAEHERKIDAYIGIGGKVTSVEDRSTGLADLSFAFKLNEKWAVGVMGAAFMHGEQLDALVDDGTYHFFGSYGGLFVERTFALTSRFNVTFALFTGQGQASYQYDNDYRQEKVWTEEIIDMTTFGVQELSAAVNYSLTARFQIGVQASYRHTSPLYLIGTDENALKAPNVGLTLKYDLF